MQPLIYTRTEKNNQFIASVLDAKERSDQTGADDNATGPSWMSEGYAMHLLADLGVQARWLPMVHPPSRSDLECCRTEGGRLPSVSVGSGHSFGDN